MSTRVILWHSWELTDAANQRFRRICRNVGAPLAVCMIAVALIQVQREPPHETPPVEVRYAQFLPPPPPPPPVQVAVVEPMAKPAPHPVEKPTPKPRPQLTAEQRAEAARGRASRAGMTAVSRELMALRASMTADQVVSGQAVIGSLAAAPRAVATSVTREGRSSGGIDTGVLSRNVGAGGLSERGITRVSSTGGGVASGTGSSKGKGARDREEIEEVFDRNKGAIYALYNRALRGNPVLQGKLVLRLTILPDGTVSHCEVAFSELKDPDLEGKLIARVKMFRFLAKDIPTVTTTKPIDFYPAT